MGSEAHASRKGLGAGGAINGGPALAGGGRGGFGGERIDDGGKTGKDGEEEEGLVAEMEDGRGRGAGVATREGKAMDTNKKEGGSSSSSSSSHSSRWGRKGPPLPPAGGDEPDKYDDSDPPDGIQIHLGGTGNSVPVLETIRDTLHDSVDPSHATSRIQDNLKASADRSHSRVRKRGLPSEKISPPTSRNAILLPRTTDVKATKKKKKTTKVSNFRILLCLSVPFVLTSFAVYHTFSAATNDKATANVDGIFSFGAPAVVKHTATVPPGNVAANGQNHRIKKEIPSRDRQHPPVGSWDDPRLSGTTTITVDVLSIGSVTRPHYQQAQRRTWAQHKAVRNFFAADEVTADQYANAFFVEGDGWSRAGPGDAAVYDQRRNYTNCTSSLGTKDLLIDHVVKCRAHNQGQSEFMRREMKYVMGNRRWLLHKKHPAGWACAQRRVGYALGRLGRLYREGMRRYDADAVDGAGAEANVLPSYLLLVDDDTYYDVGAALEHVESFRPLDVPRVHAGCLLRSPQSFTPEGWKNARWMPSNFTSPQGGMGTIFNRAALRRFALERVDCGDDVATTAGGTNDGDDNHGEKRDHEGRWYEPDERNRDEGEDHSTRAFRRNFCRRLASDRIGERSAHERNGTVSDLVLEYSSRAMHCLHSDWTVGYFANYYLLPQHVHSQRTGRRAVGNNTASDGDDGAAGAAPSLDVEWAEHVPNARIFPYKNSNMYKKAEGQCRNDGINPDLDGCDNSSDLCHYVDPARMKIASSSDYARDPSMFRSDPGRAEV